MPVLQWQLHAGGQIRFVLRIPLAVSACLRPAPLCRAPPWIRRPLPHGLGDLPDPPGFSASGIGFSGLARSATVHGLGCPRALTGGLEAADERLQVSPWLRASALYGTTGDGLGPSISMTANEVDSPVSSSVLRFPIPVVRFNRVKLPHA